MTVSFIIIAYNEEETLGTVLQDLRKQDYPHEMTEVILVDGNSADATKELMNQFAVENKSFKRVIVLDNPKRTLPCGWNLALNVACEDVIMRVDAHASVPFDFISNNIRCLKSGEKICGGYRPNMIDEEKPWKKTLLLAETSMFGSSIAPYRRNNERRYVNSIFHGAYCKEVFDKVGKYNERLNRTEDNEIHYRMRQAGYKICFEPSIISYQHTRNTLKTMLRQKYSNGYWIGKTAKICPRCLSAYHFIPGIFMIGIIITTILAMQNVWWCGCLMWGCYWGLAMGMSFASILREKKFFGIFLTLPLLFFLLHICYGAGTLKGIFSRN